jgi:hypothetical protein
MAKCKSISPDASGVVYMPGIYSKLGDGVLRSTDFGETWIHVGIAIYQAAVFGSPNHVYAMFAWACRDCLIDPALQSAPQPGTFGWTRMSTPPEMTIGPAQTATVFDGTNFIIVTANWRGGLWRFVEKSASDRPVPSPMLGSDPVPPVPSPMLAKPGDVPPLVPPAPTAPSVAPPTSPAPAANPGRRMWAAQLIGDSSETAAMSRFRQMQGKLRSALGGYEPAVLGTAIKDGTVWFRVRVEFDTRQAAEALCSKLEAAHEHCLVQRN